MKKSFQLLAVMTVLPLVVLCLPRPSAGGTDEDRIQAMLKHYSDSLERHDFTDHLSCFAEEVQWFDKALTRPALGDLLRITVFNKYYGMYLGFSNINTYTAGSSAYVVADKQWRFCGEKQAFCGQVRSRIGFTKEQGEWKISSMKDLKTYWSSKKMRMCCGD